MISDIELLQSYVSNRSQEAFGELVRRHVDLVYSSALRRVGMDSHLAEDVTQDVFAELARKSTSLLNRSALEGWLYTTGRFKAVDLLRSVRRRRERESLFMNSNQEPSVTEPEWERLRPLIDEALDSLGKADREILILRYFRSRSFVELAEVFSLTEDAARMRATRAVERLRADLAKRGIKSTAEALGLILANRAIGAAPIGLAARVAERALFPVKAGMTGTEAAFHATNTAKVATGIAAVALLLASVGAAIHEARAHTRAAHLLDEARQGSAAIGVRLKDLSIQLESANQDESKLRYSVNGLASAVELARARRAGAADLAAAGHDFISRNPDAQRLIIGHDTAHNAQKYVALFSSLGLGPEKQAQFLGLLARRSDLGLSWFTAQSDSAPAAAIAASSDPLSSDEISAQMQDLLGADGYRAYQEFIRSGTAQGLSQQLAGALYSTETPVTQTQGNQLVRILAQSSADYQSGKSMGNPTQIDWDSALSNAQAVLSGPQMDALQALRQTSAYEQAILSASNQAAGQAVDNAKSALSPTGNSHQ